MGVPNLNLSPESQRMLLSAATALSADLTSKEGQSLSVIGFVVKSTPEEFPQTNDVMLHVPTSEAQGQEQLVSESIGSITTANRVTNSTETLEGLGTRVSVRTLVSRYESRLNGDAEINSVNTARHSDFDISARLALAAQLEQTQGELGNTEKALNTAQERVGILEKELAEANEKVAAAVKQADDAAKNVGNTQGELEQTQNELKQAKAAVAAKEEELQQAKGQLQGTERELERVRETVINLNTELTTARQNAQMTSENSEKALETARKVSSNLRSQLNEAKEAEKAAEGEVKRLTEELKKAQEGGKTSSAEVVELKQQLEEALQAVEDSGKAIQKLESELKQLKGELEKAKEALENAKKALEETKAALEQARKEIERLQEELELANNRITKLEGELKLANQEIERLQEELKTVQEAAKTAQEAAEKANKEKEDAQAAAKAALEEKNKANKEKEDAQAAAKTAQEAVDKANEEAEKAAEETNKKLVAAAEREAKLQEDLDRLIAEQKQAAAAAATAAAAGGDAPEPPPPPNNQVILDILDTPAAEQKETLGELRHKYRLAQKAVSDAERAHGQNSQQYRTAVENQIAIGLALFSVELVDCFDEGERTARMVNASNRGVSGRLLRDRVQACEGELQRLQSLCLQLGLNLSMDQIVSLVNANASLLSIVLGLCGATVITSTGVGTSTARSPSELFLLNTNKILQELREELKKATEKAPAEGTDAGAPAQGPRAGAPAQGPRAGAPATPPLGRRPLAFRDQAARLARSTPDLTQGGAAAPAPFGPADGLAQQAGLRPVRQPQERGAAPPAPDEDLAAVALEQWRDRRRNNREGGDKT